MIVSLNNAGKRDLLPLAYAFASLVFKSTEDRDWLRKRFTMLSEDIFEESWAYQEMIANSKIQALREAIMDVVLIRFPQVEVFARQRVNSIEDLDELRHLNVKLSAAQTIHEAEQALQVVSRDTPKH